jgi:hypothetical protein
LWLLHQVAETYSQRPSEIVGVRDAWVAYQFDVAVLMVGRRVEKITQDGKVSVEAALASLEADGAGPAARSGTSFVGQKWADPRPMVSKKMAIPESGIW